MTAYYNENDPYAAEFLRNLIRFGAIAAGDVDERSIEDVHPDDLRSYTQCHFFAGVGIWSAALRRAGWADDRPVWTGSCPCQPFSAAGKGKGTADERHLWPAWFHLISECRPDSLFGEQVASKDGLSWLDLVQTDLEGAGYACGFGDSCAAGFGAPHIRQRLYFHAYDLRSPLQGLDNTAGARRISEGQGSESETRNEAWLRGFERRRGLGGVQHAEGDGRISWGPEPSERCPISRLRVERLANDDDARSQGCNGENTDTGGREAEARHLRSRVVVGSLGDTGRGSDERVCRSAETPRASGTVETETRKLERRRPAAEPTERSVGLGDTSSQPSERNARAVSSTQTQVHSEGFADGRLGFRHSDASDVGGPSPTNGHWRDADWLFCRDGKWRPVEPGTFPLAHGITARVGKLRAYGNGIVLPQAAEFIGAAIDAHEAREHFRLNGIFA